MKIIKCLFGNVSPFKYDVSRMCSGDLIAIRLYICSSCLRIHMRWHRSIQIFYLLLSTNATYISTQRSIFFPMWNPFFDSDAGTHLFRLLFMFEIHQQRMQTYVALKRWCPLGTLFLPISNKKRKTKLMERNSDEPFVFLCVSMFVYLFLNAIWNRTKRKSKRRCALVKEKGKIWRLFLNI